MRIFLILIISSILVLSTPTYNYGIRKTPQDIINANNIDIDSKSLKGWIRIFNSKTKTDDYGFYLSDNERSMLLIYMREKSFKKTNKYKRGIK